MLIQDPRSGVFVYTTGGVFKQKLPFPTGVTFPNTMQFRSSVGINANNEIAVGAFEHYGGSSKVYIFRYVFCRIYLLFFMSEFQVIVLRMIYYLEALYMRPDMTHAGMKFHTGMKFCSVYMNPA